MVAHATCMEEMRNAYKTFVSETQRLKSRGGRKC